MVHRAGVVRRTSIVHRVPAMRLSCVRRLWHRSGIGYALVLALVVRALWRLSCGCVSRGIGRCVAVVASVVCVLSWSR
jgi:hypothetical protein